MPTDPTDFTSRGSGPPRSAGTTPTPDFRSDATAAPLLSGMAENLFWKWRGVPARGCRQLARQGNVKSAAVADGVTRCQLAWPGRWASSPQFPGCAGVPVRASSPAADGCAGAPEVSPAAVPSALASSVRRVFRGRRTAASGRFDQPEKRKNIMRIGASLALIAIGAILKFAVHPHDTRGFDVGTAGVILMIVGAIGLLISVIWMATRRRTDVVQTGAPGAPGTSRTTYMT